MIAAIDETIIDLMNYMGDSMLDRARADRVRRMVLGTKTWPNPHRLEMKRVGMSEWAFGAIAFDEVSAGVIKVRSNLGEEIGAYETIEDLIAAGWAVD
ncbi:hypothetical protein ACVWZ4_002863 [Bradyrhizobium sp. USDA 4472]